jgi:hypothetical protein
MQIWSAIRTTERGAITIHRVVVLERLLGRKNASGAIGPGQSAAQNGSIPSALVAQLDAFFSNPASDGMKSAIVHDLVTTLKPDLAPVVQDMARQAFASGLRPGELLEMRVPEGADPKLLESFFRAAGNDCELKGSAIMSRCGTRFPSKTQTFVDLARQFGGKGDEFLDTLRRYQILR